MTKSLIFSKKSLIILAFFSVWVGWFVNIWIRCLVILPFIGHFDKEFDFWFVWTALFSFLGGLSFLPLLLIEKTRRIFYSRIQAPWFGAVYALVVFTVLLGWGFIFTALKDKTSGKFDFLFVLYTQTFVIGFIAGFIFSQFSQRAGRAGKNKKYFLIFSPFLITFLTFWIFPKYLPSVFYSQGGFVSEIAQQKILKQVKIGDSISEIEEELPGLLLNGSCEGNEGSASGNGYEIRYLDCKVTFIQVK